jgi:ribosomal protein S27E
MSSETATKSNFRGVKCHHCGKPVRVPNSVMRQESASHGRQEQNDSTFHLISRVFVLRCRSCERESVYAINQIADFDPEAAPTRHRTAVA